MELRQAEPLRVLDEHDGRVRHVDADLHDGRRHEDVQLAGGERLHHAILGVRLHPPVQQSDPIGGKDLLREMVRHLGGRLEIDLVGLLDQRIDDIGLPPGVELAADELEAPRRAAIRASRAVLIGSRPGGVSRITDTSRSPYTVSASVRGIGVAVITSTSGQSPLPRSVARCSTPNRCCSSMTTSPS